MDWIRGRKMVAAKPQFSNTIVSTPTTPARIPPLFHFIWLGDNLMPQIYNDYIRSWALTYTDCKFVLWHDKNIPSDLVTGDLIYTIDNVVCRADILRYEIIYKYGGIYVDMDFLSIHRMPPSVFFGTFFGCENISTISIGIFGSYPQNPLFLEILKFIPQNIATIGLSETNISKLTGPIFITKLSKMMANEFKNVKYYGAHHFYKYTFQEKAEGKPFVFEKYAFDTTIYGIHMWGNSWSENHVAVKRVGEFPLSIMLMNSIDSEKPYAISDSTAYEIIAKEPKNSIVIFSPLVFTGGIERQISMIINDKHFMPDYDFYILAPGVKKSVYPMENSRTKFIRYSSYEISNRLIHDIRPDVIIDNTMLYYSPSEMAIRYANVSMDKVVAILHTSTLYSKNVRDYNIRNIIHLYGEDTMHESFYDIPRSQVIPNGCVEMNENDTLRISVIGRIANDKVDIEGLKTLESSAMQIHFYGEVDDTYNTKLFPKNCLIHPHQDVWNVLENTDIIMFMRAETCPFAAIEAMSLKKYIIAKHCGGMQSMLEHYGRGFIFRSFEEVPNIITEISYKMGNIPTDVKKRYSYSEYRRRITKFLSDVISKKV
jgi:glycosyltransferase involved in cell wall biosynthesis